jgi:hypothetical protein
MAAALHQHVHEYQRNVWKPPVDNDAFAALSWASQHLTQNDFVLAAYGSAATYLPSYAGIPTTAWQIYHCAMDESKAALANKTATHRFIVRDVDQPPPASAKVVFENRAVVIVAMNVAAHARNR